MLAIQKYTRHRLPREFGEWERKKKRRKNLNLPPLIRRLPSGENLTQLTAREWPVRRELSENVTSIASWRRNLQGWEKLGACARHQLAA